MGLRYTRNVSAGPNCFESPDVRVVDGVRDIPYTGTLVAVLVPTESDREDHTGCQRLGLIFDDETTLVVDCLHSEEEIRAFRRTCEENRITRVVEHASLVPRPCPPPTNQTQIPDWSAQLFAELRPGADASS